MDEGNPSDPQITMCKPLDGRFEQIQSVDVQTGAPKVQGSWGTDLGQVVGLSPLSSQ